MITKKTCGLFGVTASLVLGAAAGYAEDPRTPSKAPTTKEGKVIRAAAVELGTAKPCPVEDTAFAAPAAPCGPKSSRGHWCRFWDWLTYRPVTHLGPCHQPASCIPPLYTYNLEYCTLPASPPKPGYPYVDNRSAAKQVKEEVAEKEGFSLLPSFFFGKSGERKATKPTAEKSPEAQQVKHAEVVPAARKVTVEVPKEEDVMLPGKDASKWRGVPVRAPETGRR